MHKLLPLALVLPMLGSAALAKAPSYDSAAPIAYMIDMSSGRVLYDRDGDKEMPPASLAKMMTVHIAFKLIRAGQLRLDQKFTMRPDTWQKWHGQGSTMFLTPNEQVSVANLLHGIVTLSGNDACVMLAEGIAGSEPAFADLMNAEAKRLGMTRSHFGTSNGWPDNDVTHVTAHDLALLAQATIEESPKLYKEFYESPSFTWGTTVDGKPITQANRNPILGRVAGADGLKTGHTEEAGYGFTGSAVQNGRRLVAVLAGLPTYNSRISEAVQFMDWGFRAWRLKHLFDKGAKVADATVQGGWSSHVDLIAPRPLDATVPRATLAPMKVKVVYDGPISAPIAKGQTIAHLVVQSADGDTQKLPLVAGEAVAKAGFFGRLWMGLMSFF